MRMMFGLVLLIGLALAGAAVYVTQGYINQTQTQMQVDREALVRIGPLVEVYVATKPLGYGAPLNPADVTRVLWPQKSLPADVFTDAAVLFPENNAQRRFVLRPMEAMEPILPVKITRPGEEAGLNARLARGMRAFAVKVDVASGVSGFVMPGDAVDIYWTGSTPNAQGEITQLIETSIRIVAVDQTADDDRVGSAIIARTVTVEATPQQVARLAQAQATGRLALSLVGKNDDTVTEAVEVDSRGLLGIENRVAVAVEQEPVCTVRTRKGAELVVMEIPCTN